jgi:hypothetical protein
MEALMQAVAGLRVGMRRAEVEALLGGPGDQRVNIYWYVCSDAVDAHGQPIGVAIGYYGPDDGVGPSHYGTVAFFEVSGLRE